MKLPSSMQVCKEFKFMNYNECMSVPTTFMARSFPSHKDVATIILLGHVRSAWTLECTMAFQALEVFSFPSNWDVLLFRLP